MTNMRIRGFTLLVLFIISINRSIGQLVHASPTAERIAYTRVGPAVSCIACVGTADYVYYQGARYPVPLDPSLPVLTLGIGLALSGSNEADIAADLDVPMFLQLAVDYINTHGGIPIGKAGNQTIHQLSMLYADTQSSPSLMRLIYSDMINQGIELFLGPFSDVMQRSLNDLLISIDKLSQQSNNQSVNVSVVTAVAFEPLTYASGLTNVFGIWGTADRYLNHALEALEFTVLSRLVNPITSASHNIYHDQKVELIDQSDDQTVNQSVNQTIKRSSNQQSGSLQYVTDAPELSSFIGLTKASADIQSLQSMYQTINEPINQSNNQTNNPTIFMPPFSQPTSSFKQSMKQSIRSASTPQQQTLVGLTSLCLFVTDDTLAAQLQQGALDWVAQTNAARAALSINQSINLQPVSLLVNTVLPNRILSASDYSNYFLTCPAGTDIVIMPMNLASAQGLALSKQRFNQVMDMNQGASLFFLPLELKIAAQGWTNWQEAVLTSGDGQVFTSLPQLAYLYIYYNYALAGIPKQPTSGLSLLRIAEIAFTMLALNRSASTHRDDFRTSMLSLSGLSTMLGTVNFNATTSLNSVAGTAVALFQFQKGGSFTGFNDTTQQYTNQSPDYPYNWPFFPRLYGEPLDASYDPVHLLLAVLITGIGTWLAFIVFEQSVFVLGASTRKKRYWQFFLFQFLSLHALAFVSTICVQTMLALGLTTSYQDIDTDLDISFAVLSIATCYGWCVLLFGAAYLVISDYFPYLWELLVSRFCPTWSRHLDDDEEEEQTGPAALSNRRSIHTIGKRMRRKVQKSQAALESSYAQELIHVLEIAIYPMYILGGMFVAGGVALSRFTLFNAWHQHAYYEVPVWCWIVTSIMDVITFAIALAAITNAFKLRIPAVFLFAATVIADWEIHQMSTKYYYDPDPYFGTGYFRGFDMTTGLIGVIALALVSVVGTIVIQFGNMKQTHSGLRQVINNRERDLVRANERKAQTKALALNASEQINAMFAALQSVTLAINPPLEFAMPMALCHGQSEKVLSITDSQSRKVRRLESRTTSNVDSMGKSVVRSSQRNNNATGPSSPRGAVEMSRSSQKQSNSHRPLISHDSNSSNSDQVIELARRPSRVLSTAAPPAVGRHVRAPTMSAPINQPIIQSINGKSAKAPPYEMSLLLSLEAQAAATRTWTDGKFAFTLPLAGTNDKLTVKNLNLQEVLSHPVTVELFKGEMIRAFSLESLTFYLLAHKYRTFDSETIRKLLALQMYKTYIVAGSPDEVNLSTDLRKAIAKNITQELFEPDLFLEAERECFVLMETNVFDKFVKNQNSAYRLACWLYVLIKPHLLATSWLKCNKDFGKRTKVLTAKQSSSAQSQLGPNGIDATFPSKA